MVGCEKLKLKFKVLTLNGGERRFKSIFGIVKNIIVGVVKLKS
jgi:hypothetical protein